MSMYEMGNTSISSSYSLLRSGCCEQALTKVILKGAWFGEKMMRMTFDAVEYLHLEKRAYREQFSILQKKIRYNTCELSWS